jgi:hypothetical protein
MKKNDFYGDRTMSTSRITLLAVFLFTFALAAQAAGKPAGKPQAASLRDGVVVDTARSIAYVMHPKGGIQAIDLARGTTLWRTTGGERPLSLADNLLIAQARPGENGELRIVALDVRKRGTVSAEADLGMPASVQAEVHDTLGQAFRVTAVPSREGIVVAWEAEVYPSLPGRGEREGRESEEGERKASGPRKQESLEGTALFDPHAGRMLSLKAAGASEAARPVFAASLSAPGSREARFSSADGRYVLTSRRTGDDASATPYRWTISDAATGAVLGMFPAEVSMSPFTIAGKRLIHVAQPALYLQGEKLVEQPLRLRALDLATGRELWTREILDTEFRGPIPN